MREIKRKLTKFDDPTKRRIIVPFIRKYKKNLTFSWQRRIHRTCRLMRKTRISVPPGPLLLRQLSVNFPHKKDCGELALGIQAVKAGVAATPTGEQLHRDGLFARAVAQSSPALRHCTRCPLDACASLTYANPANRLPRLR